MKNVKIEITEENGETLFIDSTINDENEYPQDLTDFIETNLPGIGERPNDRR